jgi:hypothetical protein
MWGIFFLAHTPFVFRRILPQRLSEFSNGFPQQSRQVSLRKN